MTSDDDPDSRQKGEMIGRITGSRPNVTTIELQVNNEPYAEKSK